MMMTLKGVAPAAKTLFRFAPGFRLFGLLVFWQPAVSSSLT